MVYGVRQIEQWLPLPASTPAPYATTILLLLFDQCLGMLDQYIHGIQTSISRGIAGCPRIYTSYRSYRRHIIKKHPEFMEGAEEDNSLSGSFDLNVPEELQLSLPCDSLSSSDTCTLPSHSAALFILKAKEERRVSQRALDGLLEDFHEICEIQRNVLRVEIKKCLDDLQCTSVVIDAVDRVIKESRSVSPFNGLHTAYLQQQYFQTHFHFVVSCIHA